MYSTGCQSLVITPFLIVCLIYNIDGGAFFLIYMDTIPLAGVGPGQVGDGGTSWSCYENGLTSLELAGRGCFSLFYSDGCWGLHILPLTTLAC